MQQLGGSPGRVVLPGALLYEIASEEEAAVLVAFASDGGAAAFLYSAGRLRYAELPAPAGFDDAFAAVDDCQSEDVACAPRDLAAALAAPANGPDASASVLAFDCRARGAARGMIVVDPGSTRPASGWLFDHGRVATARVDSTVAKRCLAIVEGCGAARDITAGLLGD